MDEKKVEAKARPKVGILKRMSLYGFELFMSLFGILTVLAVMDYCAFVLMNYLKGIEDYGNTVVGEMTIWIVAAVIVWLPVTMFFYMRSRNEAVNKPLRSESTMHKVFVSIFFFSVIVAGIGFAFAAVYSLVRVVISPDESFVDILVRVVMPSLMAVGFHVLAMFAFAKNNRPNYRLFVSIFGGIAVLMTLILFIISAGAIRGQKQDQTATEDLYIIRNAISTSYSKEGSLPRKLSDVDSLNNEVEKRLERYEYKRKESRSYELCANFKTDTQESSSSSYDYYGPGYGSSVNFGRHDKGNFCFDVQVGSSLFDDYEYDHKVNPNIVE